MLKKEGIKFPIVLGIAMSLLSPNVFSYVESNIKADISLTLQNTDGKVSNLQLFMNIPEGWKILGQQPGDIAEATIFAVSDPKNI